MPARGKGRVPSARSLPPCPARSNAEPCLRSQESGFAHHGVRHLRFRRDGGARSRRDRVHRAPWPDARHLRLHRCRGDRGTADPPRPACPAAGDHARPARDRGLARAGRRRRTGLWPLPAGSRRKGSRGRRHARGGLPAAGTRQPAIRAGRAVMLWFLPNPSGGIMVQPLTIEPVDATFGAVATGFRIAELDDETFQALYAAWLKYALLIFPGQDLTREQQIAFARRFGPLEFEMTALSNVKEDGTLRLEKDNDDRMKVLKGNMGWHADSTYMPVQAKGAVFCAEEVPTIGGHTGWADM